MTAWQIHIHHSIHFLWLRASEWNTLSGPHNKKRERDHLHRNWFHSLNYASHCYKCHINCIEHLTIFKITIYNLFKFGDWICDNLTVANHHTSKSIRYTCLLSQSAFAANQIWWEKKITVNILHRKRHSGGASGMGNN